MSRVQEFEADLIATISLQRKSRIHLTNAKNGLTGGGMQIVEKARKRKLLTVTNKQTKKNYPEEAEKNEPAAENLRRHRGRQADPRQRQADGRRAGRGRLPARDRDVHALPAGR